MSTLALAITDAGEAAIQGASGSDKMVIAYLGLTDTVFDYAPTLTALPGEFKRLDVTSGTSASANITHLTVYDTSSDVWTATGLGLFASDGTLVAIYTGADALLTKSAQAFALFTFDIAFEADIATSIAYGNATFIDPPATEDARGVAEIATQDETDAGTDDSRFVTPLKLTTLATALLTPIKDSITAAVASLTNLINGEAGTRATADGTLQAAIGSEADARAAADAGLQTAINNEAGTRATADGNLQAEVSVLQNRSITGGGLATGGGDLTADRTLTVTAATATELQAATDNTKAVTPAAFGSLPRSAGTTSYEVIPGGTLIQRGLNRVGYTTAEPTIAVTFPVAFADTNYDLQLTVVIPGNDGYDSYVQEIYGTRTTTGVTVKVQSPNSNSNQAIQGFNWRAEGKI